MEVLVLKMDKKDYTMIILSTILLASIGLNVMPEPTHECDSRELKAYCFDLSSTGKTCYTLPNKIGGKRCTEGWKEIEKDIEVPLFKTDVSQWECNSKECVSK